MPALSDYTAGTITLTNGSVNFTGAGTGWQAADFREGDTILGIEDNAGVEYVIASIDGNGAGTLTQEWEGATGTYTYRMRYLADGARVTAQARNLIELLGNGNLQALAGLTGPGVPVFNGPHAMEIKPVTDFGDVVGPSGAVADRIAVFDGTTGKRIKDGGVTVSEIVPADRSITNAKLADMETARIKGRVTAGNGVPEDLTATQVWSLLGLAPVANIPGTLTPDKAYRHGNILGTVSQSAGVPTGAIIESGSNASGQYVRFADGTQICTQSYSGNYPVNVADGSLFRSGELSGGFTAALFSSPPKVSIFTNGGLITAGGTTPTTNTFGGIFLFYGSSITNPPATISLIAIGRWF